MRWIGVEPQVIGNITPRESVADFRTVFCHEIVRRLRRDRNSLNMEVVMLLARAWATVHTGRTSTGSKSTVTCVVGKPVS